ncbi:hypothetical protein BT69DRAFT_1345890 [Atractiella rhizophila]|nr:hypothetical protein BT69DRAFT_1345890 [Atractiella rhizophila]
MDLLYSRLLPVKRLPELEQSFKKLRAFITFTSIAPDEIERTIEDLLQNKDAGKEDSVVALIVSIIMRADGGEKLAVTIDGGRTKLNWKDAWLARVVDWAECRVIGPRPVPYISYPPPLTSNEQAGMKSEPEKDVIDLTESDDEESGYQPEVLLSDKIPPEEGHQETYVEASQVDVVMEVVDGVISGSKMSEEEDTSGPFRQDKFVSVTVEAPTRSRPLRNRRRVNYREVHFLEAEDSDDESEEEAEPPKKKQRVSSRSDTPSISESDGRSTTYSPNSSNFLSTPGLSLSDQAEKRRGMSANHSTSAVELQLKSLARRSRIGQPADSAAVFANALLFVSNWQRPPNSSLTDFRTEFNLPAPISQQFLPDFMRGQLTFNRSELIGWPGGPQLTLAKVEEEKLVKSRHSDVLVCVNDDLNFVPQFPGDHFLFISYWAVHKLVKDYGQRTFNLVVKRKAINGKVNRNLWEYCGVYTIVNDDLHMLPNDYTELPEGMQKAWPGIIASKTKLKQENKREAFELDMQRCGWMGRLFPKDNTVVRGLLEKGIVKLEYGVAVCTGFDEELVKALRKLKQRIKEQKWKEEEE